MRARSYNTETQIIVEVRKLPRNPSIIRYWDQFSNDIRTVQEDGYFQSWTLTANGASFRLNFEDIEIPFFRSLIKRWAAWALGSLSPATVRIYFNGFRHAESQLSVEALADLLTASPYEISKTWRVSLLTSCSPHVLRALKSLLKYCSQMCIGELKPHHIDFISALRMPSTGKSYAAVRSGGVFISARDETAIVAYLDSVNTALPRVVDTETIDLDEVQAACVLAASYQYAMRPTQIAQVRLSDLRLYLSDEKNLEHIVHITFLKAKQRSSRQQLPMTRKIKREWGPIFAAIHTIRSHDSSLLSRPGALPDSLFGLNPAQISNLICDTTERITGSTISANQLRHTAAQRLVDAGATKEELADFMGHSRYATGLVYFDISPTQAERVNKALAVSTIYSAVAEVARTRWIDKEALLKRTPDQQIGGVPHGVPIAGIGACELGQSLCNKNPVLTCYTCPKFLPVSDDDIHRKTVVSLREIVMRFYDASRGDTQAPAFMQLRQTLVAAESLINEDGLDGEVTFHDY